MYKKLFGDIDFDKGYELMVHLVGYDNLKPYIPTKDKNVLAVWDRMISTRPNDIYPEIKVKSSVRNILRPFATCYSFSNVICLMKAADKIKDSEPSETDSMLINTVKSNLKLIDETKNMIKKNNLEPVKLDVFNINLINKETKELIKIKDTEHIGTTHSMTFEGYTLKSEYIGGKLWDCSGPYRNVNYHVVTINDTFMFDFWCSIAYPVINSDEQLLNALLAILVDFNYVIYDDYEDFIDNFGYSDTTKNRKMYNTIVGQYEGFKAIVPEGVDADKEIDRLRDLIEG